jgi:hypothetical protein
LRFYIGIAKIAAFLRLSEAQVKKMIEGGEIPAKKDGKGRVVLCNLDYYRSREAKGREKRHGAH